MTKWAVLLAALLMGGEPAASRQAPTSATVLADVRTALGGARLDGIASLVAEGESQRTLGPLRLSGSLELRLLRPDRYLRLDGLAVGTSRGETATGFNGDRVIQRASLPGAPTVDATAALPADVRGTMMTSGAGAIRHDLRLLLLGFFGGTFDRSALSAGELMTAEAGTVQAHAVPLTFADGSQATLYIERAGALPLMVSWRAPNPLAALRDLGRGTDGQRSAGPAIDPAVVPMAEHRYYFGDYRRTGDVRWPFAVRRAIDGEVVEEIRFRRFQVDARLDAAQFEAGR